MLKLKTEGKKVNVHELSPVELWDLIYFFEISSDEMKAKMKELKDLFDRVIEDVHEYMRTYPSAARAGLKYIRRARYLITFLEQIYTQHKDIENILEKDESLSENERKILEEKQRKLEEIFKTQQDRTRRAILDIRKHVHRRAYREVREAVIERKIELPLTDFVDFVWSVERSLNMRLYSIAKITGTERHPGDELIAIFLLDPVIVDRCEENPEDSFCRLIKEKRIVGLYLHTTVTYPPEKVGLIGIYSIYWIRLEDTIRLVLELIEDGRVDLDKVYEAESQALDELIKKYPILGKKDKIELEEKPPDVVLPRRGFRVEFIDIPGELIQFFERRMLSTVGGSDWTRFVTAYRKLAPRGGMVLIRDIAREMNISVQELSRLLAKFKDEHPELILYEHEPWDVVPSSECAVIDGKEYSFVELKHH